MEQQEQNRTEEATPFKLKRAREKGQVARGMDLGFVGSLLAFAAFVLIIGPAFVSGLGELMRIALTTGIARAADTGDVFGIIRSEYPIAFKPILTLGGIIVVLLVCLELIQLRGLIFTTQPLKPDFKRLNPVQGLKRLFSIKMLKETVKNVIKMAVYTALAWVMITGAMEIFADSIADANSLVLAMESAAKRLLFAFLCAALIFMVIDQIIVRSEFRKQMRMSRREVTREAKEREGEPRFKQKRKEIHAEMRKQTEGLNNLDGSDFLITNPEHYAVALHYAPGEMQAPVIRAMGRNHFAQLLKRKARLLGLPVIADPPLARALHSSGKQGASIDPEHFHAVARHYTELARQDGNPGLGPHVEPNA